MLLVSKMAGHSAATKEADIDPASGILKNQKILAEAVETTCTANDIHRDGVLNMQNLQYAGISKASLYNMGSFINCVAIKKCWNESSGN